MKGNKDLYDMKLFEVCLLGNNSLMRRVPGGWVYSDTDGCCFVPYNGEFKRNHKEVK